MARILLLTLVFRPDNVSTAQIMADLAKDLKDRGHSLFVLTTTPHYNDDPEAKSRQPLRYRWGFLLQESTFEGIPVVHVWMPRKGPNKLVRMLAWLGFHAVSTGYGLLSRFKPDVIVAPSPPLTIGVSAWILGLRHRAPFIYNVQEIYPDVAVHLGALGHPFLIRRMQQLEQFVYRKAAALTTISAGMRQRLLNKGVPPDKVHLIPNFVDVTEFEPSPKDNTFSRAQAFHDKFLVSYAGNMGKPQGLETLVHTAQLLRAEPDIHFLLMGDGSERESLGRLAASLRLSNLTLLPHQPYALMGKAYAAADLSFVSQVPGTSSDGIPSKVYRIMACARPVLACTDPGSDLARILSDAGAGMVVPPGDSHKLAEVIRGASRDRNTWRQMGLKGRAHVVTFYGRASVSDRYHELISSLCCWREEALVRRATHGAV